MADEDFEIESSSARTVNLPKEAVFYWIHCNRCFELYAQRRSRIFLLACNHTICEKCAATPPRNAPNGSNELICPICKKMQRFRVLCNVMPAQFKELLNPQPWREPTERILNFQTKQRAHFKKGMFNRLVDLDKMRKRCKLLEMNSKKKYEKYEQLRFERKRLEREVRRFKQQESRQNSMYFQTAEKGGPNHMITDVRTQRSTQRSMFNNSFVLSLI